MRFDTLISTATKILAGGAKKPWVWLSSGFTLVWYSLPDFVRSRNTRGVYKAGLLVGSGAVAFVRPLLKARKKAREDQASKRADHAGRAHGIAPGEARVEVSSAGGKLPVPAADALDGSLLNQREKDAFATIAKELTQTLPAMADTAGQHATEALPGHAPETKESDPLPLRPEVLQSADGDDDDEQLIDKLNDAVADALLEQYGEHFGEENYAEYGQELDDEFAEDDNEDYDEYYDEEHVEGPDIAVNNRYVPIDFDEDHKRNNRLFYSFGAAMLAANLVLIGLVVWAEKAIFRLGNRRQARGKRLAHTLPAVGLAAMTYCGSAVANSLEQFEVRIETIPVYVDENEEKNNGRKD